MLFLLLCLSVSDDHADRTVQPLYLEVCAALAQLGRLPKVLIGGQYGICGTQYRPTDALEVFDFVRGPEPKHGFNVGIIDDLMHTRHARTHSLCPRTSTTSLTAPAPACRWTWASRAL
jgi:hypothetical protein